MSLSTRSSDASWPVLWTRHGLTGPERPRTALSWIADELRRSAHFVDIDTTRHDTALELGPSAYVELVSTFSSIRRLTEAARSDLLQQISAGLEAVEGRVDLDVRTALTVARRRR